MPSITVEIDEDDYSYAVKARAAVAHLTLYGLKTRYERVKISRYHGSQFHMELIATYYTPGDDHPFVMGAIKRHADSEWSYHS